jgi:hypothetical protein
VSDERPPPDFALTRAADILYQLYQKQRRTESVRPPPLDRVVQLFNETIAFDVTKTTRKEVERALGIAFAYPVRGWHTYCVAGAAEREFVSLFYSQGTLLSAELYLPRSDRAPNLAPRNLGRFRLVPGEIAIGMQIATLPDGYARVPKPDGLGPYEDIFEARFPGGSVYVMGNGGVIERAAIYGLRDAAAPQSPR